MGKKFVTYLECDLPKLVLSGPLGPRTMFTLHVNGPWNAATSARMLQIVEMQRAWLLADEQDAKERAEVSNQQAIEPDTGEA